MDEKTNLILNECYKVFNQCQETISWMETFIKENPSILNRPSELDYKITSTRLALFDVKIMLENSSISLGKNEEKT